MTCSYSFYNKLFRSTQVGLFESWPPFKALSHCTANPREINSREIPGFFSPHQHPSDRSHCNSWGGISRGYAQSFRVINPVQTLVQHKTPGFYPLTLLPRRVEHSPGKSYSPGISFVVWKDWTNIPRQCPSNSPGICVVWKGLECTMFHGQKRKEN